jgi:hypothetical protein
LYEIEIGKALYWLSLFFFGLLWENITQQIMNFGVDGFFQILTGIALITEDKHRAKVDANQNYLRFLWLCSVLS